jgi:hypothetical protein
MGLDVNLEFAVPTDEVKEIIDQYLTCLGKKVAKTKPLEQGTTLVLDLIIYMKQTATFNASANSKNDQLRQELELVLNSKYEMYEKMSFWMVSDEDAIVHLHKAIKLCFWEVAEPEKLHDQIKFVLAMAILAGTGRVMNL